MSMDTISASQMLFYMAHPNYQVVDLRSSEAYEAGHIAGAINISYENLQDALEVLPRSKTYIVYCQKGSTSLRAARWMDRQGFDVLSLGGGSDAFIYGS